MPGFILADIESIGIVVFLVVSFISWILNMKNQGQKPANRNPNRPGRPAQVAGGKRPDALKNELEMFLEEVTGAKPQRKQNQPQRPPEPAKTPRRRVEQQRPDGPRPRPAAVQQQQPRRRKPRKKPRPKPRKQTAQARPEPQPRTRRELGSKLRDHVDDYMGEKRIKKHVDEHLADGVSGRQEKRIGQSVKEHLGSSISHVPVQVEVDPPSATTAGLVKMLRNPGSVRNAIMVAEILQRPKSMR